MRVVCFQCLTYFLYIGWYIRPKAIPLKILFLTSYLSGVILFAAYNATLVSKFSIRSNILKSFEHLLEQNFDFALSSQSISMTNYKEVQHFLII